MPIIKSAIKQMKQAEAARDRNRAVKASFKSKVKLIQKDLDAGGKNASVLASEAFSAIDKAAKRGIIHKNAAARKKAKISIQLTQTLKKDPEFKSFKEKPVKTTKNSKAKKAR